MTQTELYPEQISRPSAYSKEIRAAAAASFAKQMHQTFSDWSEEEWAEALATNYSPHEDGYELAKSLERHGFTPDAEMVYELDNFGSEISSARRAAEKEWVIKVGFTPLFKIGDPVDLGERYEKHGGRMGKVSEIFPETAEYGVKTDPDSSSTYIIKAEDLVAADVK